MSRTTTPAPAHERDPLERLGNAVWIAVLTVVASLGVVTALAAFAAGLRAMSGVGDASRAPATEFWATLRASWRRSLPLAALWLGVGTIAVGDLVLAPSLPEPLPAVVTTTGLVLAFGLVQLWPYLAMELSRSAPGSSAGAGALLKGAAARAGRRPASAALAGLLGLVVVAAMIAVPALAPVSMAVYLAACTGIAARTTNDDRAASTTQRPTLSARSTHASRTS